MPNSVQKYPGLAMSTHLNCILCEKEVAGRFGMCTRCYNDLRAFYLSSFEQQPEAERSLDQFGMDFDSLVAHCAFMFKDVKEKVVCCLGGHDGTGLMLSRFKARKVVVLDIHTPVLEWSRKVGKGSECEIVTHQYDARKPFSSNLDNELRESHISAWRTDPPYNCAGIQCFLTRIFYHVKRSPAQTYLCVPLGASWSQLVMHDAWKFINSSGFEVIDVSARLSNYPQLEGMTSCTWKIWLHRSDPEIKNGDFSFDLYHPTPEFCVDQNKCEDFDYCRDR